MTYHCLRTSTSLHCTAFFSPFVFNCFIFPEINCLHIGKAFNSLKLTDYLEQQEEEGCVGDKGS